MKRDLPLDDAGEPRAAGPAVRLPSPAAWMARWRPAASGAIGLEISSDRINLVQFDTPGGAAAAPLLRAAVSVPYEGGRAALAGDPRRLRELVAGACRRHRFVGRTVVSCLPSEALRILPIGYTLTEGRTDEACIAAEMRERLKDELDEAVVDFLPVRNGDATRRDALVVVAQRAAVLEHVRLLERAGLDVRAIDIGPAALARMVSFVNAADSREQYPTSLVVNFACHKTHLSVVSGRRLMLDRTIEFGELPLVDRVARVLEVDAAMARKLLREKGCADAGPATGGAAGAGSNAGGASGASGIGGASGASGTPGARDELARVLYDVLRSDFALLSVEVSETLSYTASRSRGRGIDQIYLLGSVGRYPGVAALLQELLSVPVARLDPLGAFAVRPGGPDARAIEPVAGVALACGLALRGMQAYA